MAAMATQTDVVAELGRALTSDESARVDAALERASDYVRAETKRRFEAGTYTVTRRPRNGRVTLDGAATVTAVNTVDATGTASEVDATSYTLRGNTVYGLTYACEYEITYTSDGTVPAELVRVVAAMASRDITNEVPAGATSYSWTKGPFGASAGFDEPVDSVTPSPSEERIIRKYALRSYGSVNLVR